MLKKLVLSTLFILPLAAANALELGEVSPGAQEAVNTALAKAKNASGKNLLPQQDPIVFTMLSTYELRVISLNEDGSQLHDITYREYDNTLAGRYREATCAATLISKNWVLTHSDCLHRVRTPYTVMDEDTQYYTDYSLKSFALSYDGYAVKSVNGKNLRYHEDPATGAVLLNINTACVEGSAQHGNICVNLWDKLVKNDNVFRLPTNYKSIILTNIKPQDDVAASFTRGDRQGKFFVPGAGKLFGYISGVKANVLQLGAQDYRPRHAALGLPLFMQTDNGNILVAFNTARGSLNFKLLSPSFTEATQKAFNPADNVTLTANLAMESKIALR